MKQGSTMGPVSQGARAPPGGRNNNQRQQVQSQMPMSSSGHPSAQGNMRQGTIQQIIST